MNLWSSEKKKGFTIVELLIVVVVIAILAAITIVAYNGIQNRARGSAAQSTLNSALKKIETYAVTANEQFPTSVTACPSPGATEICIPAGDSQSVISYSVNNTASPNSFCMDIIRGDAAYFVDDAGKVAPGSCGLRSCYEIQQAGGSHGSGTYWIKPTGVAQPIRAYCDMETSGGGWTLLVNNVGPSNSWNGTNVYNLNGGAPSTTANYSALQYANDIKANLSGRLNYRMDAVNLGQWGGVWDAPYSATLEGTSIQNVASLTTQYSQGSWTLDSDVSDGTSAPSNVIPYVSTTGQTGLLTWGGTGNWFGTIVTYSGWAPAPWISSQNGGNPGGPIRYWVK